VRTAVVTGASRGIGAAIAEGFADVGYNVVINYNQSPAPAFSLADRLSASGAAVLLCKADVSVQAEVEAMLSAAAEKFGGADILVNNAGIAEQALFSDISEAMWDRMFDVNIKSMFLCTKAFLPFMLSRKYGRIINISSMWGICGASMEVHYSASKAAVTGFTKALAKETGPSGVTVNCIAPGLVATDMNKDIDESTLNGLITQTPLNRIGTPEDIANLALFLASEKSGFITGQIISADGGFL